MIIGVSKSDSDVTGIANMLLTITLHPYYDFLP